jgi:hypothetical protein
LYRLAELHKGAEHMLFKMYVFSTGQNCCWKGRAYMHCHCNNIS